MSMMSDRDLKLRELGESSYKEIKKLVDALFDDPDNESTWDTIRDDALSVETRSDWTVVGASQHERHAAAQYRITITTGGPAVQIIGDLDQYNEPSSATLQTQDWFMPWTDYPLADEDVLLAYARCFYFGE